MQGVLRLLGLLAGGVQQGLRGLKGGLRLLHGGLLGGLLGGELFALPAQAAELIGAGEDAAAARGAAAGEGAAGIDDLPVERDDADAVAEAFGDGHGAVEVFGDQRAAEEVRDDIGIARVALNEIARNADVAGLRLRLLV